MRSLIETGTSPCGHTPDQSLVLSTVSTSFRQHMLTAAAAEPSFVADDYDDELSSVATGKRAEPDDAESDHEQDPDYNEPAQPVQKKGEFCGDGT